MASRPCWAHGLAEKCQVGQCEERGSHVGVGLLNVFFSFGIIIKKNRRFKSQFGGVSE